jgi:hypothetical protein
MSEDRMEIAQSFKYECDLQTTRELLRCAMDDLEAALARVATLEGALVDREFKIAAVTTEREGLRRDAERYRKLRLLNWPDSALCVVSNPRETLRLGAYCPSQERLDGEIDAIDAALQSRPERRKGERKVNTLFAHSINGDANNRWHQRRKAK